MKNGGIALNFLYLLKKKETVKPSWQRIRCSCLHAFPFLRSKFRAQTSLQLPNPIPNPVYWSRCQVADLLKNKEEEENKLAELERLPVETMWMADLDYFIQVLEVRGKPRFQNQNLILVGVIGESLWRAADITLHLAGLWRQ